MPILELLGKLAIVIAIPACVAAAPADWLTLDQAVAMAVEQNRGVRNSALDVQKAQDRLDAARTRQYPSASLYMLGAQQLRSFDFTLEKGVLGTYAGTGPLPSEDVHLSSPMAPTGFVMGKVSQPLSALFRIRRNIDALKTGVELAAEQTRADHQKVVRDVKRAYYALQQVESSLRTVRETAGLYREIEKLTSNYVLQQVALRSDLLDIRTRVAKTDQSESELLDRAASGKEQLNQLLGRDVLTEFEVQPVLEASGYELPLAEARARALQQRPEIRQAELRQKQAEQDMRAKRAEYIPEVAAEFSSMTLLNYGRFLPLQSNSVGLSLSWEPFDWGRKKHEVAEKQRTIEQARYQHQDAVSAVLIDINDKQRKLRQSETQLRVARLSQEWAVESARVVKNKYAVQAVLLKDMLQAQVSLEQSNSDYEQALVSFWNARAEFEHALGEDQ
jgi:outer membrane protein